MVASGKVGTRMIGFILRRTFYMLIVLFIISMISFTIIELPPGDYLTSYIARLKQTGGAPSPKTR